MLEYFQKALLDWQAQSSLEIVAVVLSMAYLILAIRQSLWCWPAAFASTALFAVLFFDVKLVMESLLNVFYLAMAVYGFYQWKFGNPTYQQTKSQLKITSWPLKSHLIIITGLTTLSIINGFLLSQYTNASLPYLDSFTTWFAVFTTYLVAKKVFENWYYWIIIDIASAYMYAEKGLYLVSLQMIVYVALCFVGIYSWRRELSQVNSNNQTQLAQS